MSSFASGSEPKEIASTSALVTLDTVIPARSTLQQRVLTEEAYTSTLSDLIRRDFFPQLERLEAENAYLDALIHTDEPGGEEGLERAVRRLVGHEIRDGIVAPTPRPHDTVRSKRQFETPDSTPGSIRFDDADTPRMSRRGRSEWDPTPLPHIKVQSVQGGRDDDIADADRAPPIDDLTLSSFQAQYTSEDNASFLEILKVNEAKRREKYRWAYEAEEKANGKRKKALQSSEQQARIGFRASLDKAPYHVKKKIQAGLQPKMITSNGEVGKSNEGQVMLAKDDQGEKPGLPEISPALDEARSLNSWSHRARNPLFFGPDANISTHSQRTSSLPHSSNTGSDSIFSRDSHVPGINFNNTRLPEDDDLDETKSRGSETPRSSRIDAAIGGWGDTASDAGSQPSSLFPPASPRIAGYSFVSPLPSPRPGDLGEERVKQLMTWGSIVGTPRAVNRASDEGDHYDGSFRIPPTPSRDLLARRLADRSGSNRKRITSSSTRKSSSKKKSRVDLSPAGRTLLDRTSRGSTGLSSLGSSLLANRDQREKLNSRLKRERWTPSPSPRR